VFTVDNGRDKCREERREVERREGGNGEKMREK
jgi:hypothetical protein